MNDALSTFEDLLFNKLIPDFCSDPRRNLEISGFRNDSLRVSEIDARYFLLAWQSGLIIDQGRGIYRAAQSGTGEQFFWEGPRASDPRYFTLWLEPAITFGGLARLYFDFNWPTGRLGCQSADWAFDLVAFLPDQADEYIAGEIKKTSKEVDDLIGFMKEYGADPSVREPEKSGKERNAYKKIRALRARKAPLFWALGPDGDSRVFRVIYGNNGSVHFTSVDETLLQFLSFE